MMTYRAIFLAAALTCAGCHASPDTDPSPDEHVTTDSPPKPAQPMPAPTMAEPSPAPRPIDDILDQPRPEGSAWYIYDKGTGQFAAVIGSTEPRIAEGIQAGLDFCEEGQRFAVLFDAGLSIDLAPGHSVECALLALDGGGTGLQVIPGTARKLVVPGKQVLSISAEITISKDGPCSLALQAAAPMNEGADTFAVEGWAALRMLPL